MNNLFKIGFAREDITPDEYMTLAGFGNDSHRLCNNVMDRLAGTSIVMEDQNGQRLIFICLDLLHSFEPTVTRQIRDTLSEAFHIARDRIMVSASHTHAGPSFYCPEEDEPTARFFVKLKKQLVKATREAIEDLAPATVEIGKREFPRMTFKRHYRKPDGTVATNASGGVPVGPGDTQMQIMRFVRENAMDIVLINWQAHATIISASDRKDMSFDYPGILRTHVEMSLGCHCAFLQGACGDMVPTCRTPELNVVDPGDHVAYGRLLAEKALELLREDMHTSKLGLIKTLQYTYSSPVDHTEDYRVPDALKCREGYLSLPKEEQLARNKQYGFRGWLHSGMIINRSKKPANMEFELNAISIGDVSFATAPYEMFSSNGRFVKDNTPFDMSFMCAYCNGNNSYIADDEAFDYTSCYEVDSRYLFRGAAEEIASVLVDLLKQVKAQ